ncbi:unnamed protein product [Meganyctiphanes norvegica]|uniref:C-type lectin domain-containing protein n=1 Tax=Meganyctiphanes norvegica TaxID=48144 RepID=A0AAV2RHB2_MEGNR
MKGVSLLLSTIIAVLIVDCYNLHDEPGGQDLLDEAQQAPDLVRKGHQDPDSAGGTQQLKKTVHVDDSERKDKQQKKKDSNVINVYAGVIQTDVMEKIQNLTINQHSMEDNIIQRMSELKEHLDVKEKIQNLTLDQHSMEDNIIQQMSELKEHLDVKEKIQNLTIDQHSMEDNIIQRISELKEHIDTRHCPASFFKIGYQCYKLYNDRGRSYSWDDCKTKCEAEDLVMASKPNDTLTLREYIVKEFGNIYAYVFMGARGDGTEFRWENTGEVISNNDPLWHPRGRPTPPVSTSKCLVLLTHSNNVNADGPTTPYFPLDCSSHQFVLCEYLMQ